MRNTVKHISLIIISIMSISIDAAHAQSIDDIKTEMFGIIDKNNDKIGRVNDAIYSYSELGFQEYKTVSLVTKVLEEHGYKVELGVAGMPTAYMARYGSGAPVIGIMADFDGVPGTSQKPATLVHDPIVPGGPGHGEGHNSNVPAQLGAVIALKEIKDRYRLPGTIIVYGGPAEELLASRGYMVKAGLFKGVDAAIDLHIGSELRTGYGLAGLSIISVEWSFKGKQAHGATPAGGRSALDSVEVMNVATNYMREHMEPEARIHYVITDGGKQPNVVPPDARVWYYFRHTTAEKVWALFRRGRDAAKGAALATGTEVSERILSASWPFYGNKELAEVVQKNIELVGMPKWSEADQAFARAYQKAMGAPVVGMPTAPAPIRNVKERGSGSSDTGDITWQIPYARLFFPAQPPGHLEIHHWSAGVGNATPLTHKGIAAGSKVAAASMLDLIMTPQLLDQVKQGFKEQIASSPPWKSLIPPTASPPLHLSKAEMDRYRNELRPFEYDPSSSQTYLEFMKIPYPPAEPSTAIGKASNEQPASAQGSSIDWEW